MVGYIMKRLEFIIDSRVGYWNKFECGFYREPIRQRGGVLVWVVKGMGVCMGVFS